MSLRQKLFQTLAAGMAAMVLLLAGCGGGGSSMPSDGTDSDNSGQGIDGFLVLQTKAQAWEALEAAMGAWENAVEAARIARMVADGAEAANTDATTAATAATAAEMAAENAEEAYMAAKAAYDSIDEDGTLEAARMALEMVQNERDKALMHLETAQTEQDKAQVAGTTSSYRMFVQMNGQDINEALDDPNTSDVDESTWTLDRVRTAETNKFAKEMAFAADTGGLPRNSIKRVATSGADVSVLWAAEDDTVTTSVDESELRILIDIDTTEGSNHFNVDDLSIDYVEMNYLTIIDGLGDFVHGYQIWREDNTDQTKAIVFTDKQQGTPFEAEIVETEPGELVNIDSAFGVVDLSTAMISPDGQTVDGVTYYDSVADQNLGSYRGYTGSLTCDTGASETCDYNIVNGDLTLIGPYRFTGRRERTEMSPLKEKMENPDYLVFGIWLYEDDADETESFGAFADSGMAPQSYNETDFQGIEGKASYTGNAFGAHHLNGVISWFDADAELEIDFRTNSQTLFDTTVSGEIFNIRVAGGEALSDSIYLTKPLGGDNIVDQAVMGRQVGSIPGINDTWEFEGDWTFNSYGPNNAKPGSVAGTFGVANSDDSEIFVGAYGARRSDGE